MIRKYEIWWGPRGYNVLDLNRPIGKMLVIRVLLYNGAPMPDGVA